MQSTLETILLWSVVLISLMLVFFLIYLNFFVPEKVIQKEKNKRKRGKKVLKA